MSGDPFRTGYPVHLSVNDNAWNNARYFWDGACPQSLRNLDSTMDDPKARI